jgi:hypothetical protein
VGQSIGVHASLQEQQTAAAGQQHEGQATDQGKGWAMECCRTL